MSLPKNEKHEEYKLLTLIYMKKVVLLDGNALMHRSFHAVKFAPIYQGKPIGMVFGFGSSLLQIIEQFQPNFFYVAFDTKEKTFRHKLDDTYKAHRKKAPDEFYDQLPLIFELVEQFQLNVLKKPGFEADDIIGTLAKRAEKENLETFILSGDLDFLQLISDRIHLAKFNGKTPLMFDRAKTHEKLGIWPEQIVDYKAICGDSSDNYKGVAGLGPKNCVQLLEDFKTLEGIYENLDQIKSKVREKLEIDKKKAFHCQTLAQIHLNVPVESDFSEKNEFQFSPDTISKFFDQLNFLHLKKRTENLNKRLEQGDKQEQNKDTKKSDNEAQTSLF
ncbi:hypothetical protein KAI58_00250 [Candidatus Gracilibacteria bacterium]|nr:hypothetical protein [Candidatus Gracilibacteria bacterium]